MSAIDFMLPSLSLCLPYLAGCWIVGYISKGKYTGKCSAIGLVGVGVGAAFLVLCAGVSQHYYLLSQAGT